MNGETRLVERGYPVRGSHRAYIPRHPRHLPQEWLNR
ncbi:hypothetical protein SAMN05216268_14311 [Streptomyces yunnanensis]|uniref:Uncharacterized protein n=1 Tax=Streptomyces yunnanensis TaxID=156453 RepID=A0A9X8N9M3_9ACTN|nr:hypothetical protein SAMN05216268_14311 [Streptomyces yunnanensis]